MTQETQAYKGQAAAQALGALQRRLDPGAALCGIVQRIEGEFQRALQRRHGLTDEVKNLAEQFVFRVTRLWRATHAGYSARAPNSYPTPRTV